MWPPPRAPDTASVSPSATSSVKQGREPSDLPEAEPRDSSVQLRGLQRGDARQKAHPSLPQRPVFFRSMCHLISCEQGINQVFHSSWAFSQIPRFSSQIPISSPAPRRVVLQWFWWRALIRREFTDEVPPCSCTHL